MYKTISESKKENSKWNIMPVKDEKNIQKMPENSWVWYNGKRCILPTCEFIWGGEQAIRQKGYKKYWSFFENTKTGEMTFGNKPSFSKSQDEKDRERAKNMPVVNLELLKTL